jgi:mitochondrial import receptor subunit TOM20
MIYQKTVPDAVFKIVMELTNHDVSSGGKDDGIDEDTGGGAGDSGSTTASRSTSRRGPPSETSSQEWDKLTDPGPPSVSG